ncbi:hypothetical protein BVU76_23550 [Mycolicibacterium porcinum]|nr:hypothetical protein BVU76_23550 [Mycolicibacterium porcinum]
MADLDARAWSTATWTAPFITQLVLGVVFTIWWLLGKQLFELHGLALFLAIAVIVTLAAVLTTVSLLISPSSRAHGLAISVAGSSAVVLLGGMLYGFWVIRW